MTVSKQINNKLCNMYDIRVIIVADRHTKIELTESEELSRSMGIDRSYMSMSGRHDQVPYGEYSYVSFKTST